MPARAALALLPKVGRVLTPFFAKVTRPENLKKDLMSPAVFEALGDAFAAADGTKIEDIADKLLAQVEQDGKPIGATWNVLFAGNTFGLLRVLQFAIAAEYGDFLRAFGNRAPAPKADTEALPGLPSGTT
jgi:hypothetical protein